MLKHSVLPSAEILITSYFTNTGHSPSVPLDLPEFLGNSKPLQFPNDHPEMVHDPMLMPQGVSINIVHGVFLCFRFSYANLEDLCLRFLLVSILFGKVKCFCRLCFSNVVHIES